MSRITKVPVSVSQSYDVYVGSNLWEAFRKFCSERYSSHKLVVLIDEEVLRLHGESIYQECEAYFKVVLTIPIPQGEQSKSIAMWNKILDKLLEEGIERTTPLLAVGGGVTGDLSGYVAASVLRGIPLIHMPTTLLAMVDSSIGGKTGVNHQVGKNLIGAFYHPDAVFADTNFLKTLPAEEWINALAEILKYAAISQPSIFDDATACVASGFSPSDSWTELIGRCASIKIDVVSKDAMESGVRAYLNFGHTFGHALEKIAGYGTISHGEAVFIGMLAAKKASRLLGAKLKDEPMEPFISLYPVSHEITSLDIDELVEAMSRDKKVENGRIRLILLKEWGSPYIEKCEDKQLLREAWKSAFNEIKTKK